MTAALVHRRFLDPRPAALTAADPLSDAVNIPLDELPERTHELPPAHKTILLAAGGPAADAALAWLRDHGRSAVLSEKTARVDPAPHAHNPQSPVMFEIGRLWEPTAFLADIEPRIRAALGGHRLRSLDLACGTGRDAIWLAARGWEATGVDILPDAIARARALAARCAPALNRVMLRPLDLTRESPAEPASCELVSMFRYLDRERMPVLLDCVAARGFFAIETFTRAHRDRFGKPSRDAHLLQEGELPALLPGFEILIHETVQSAHAITARALARRM